MPTLMPSLEKYEVEEDKSMESKEGRDILGRKMRTKKSGRETKGQKIRKVKESLNYLIFFRQAIVLLPSEILQWKGTNVFFCSFNSLQ